MRGPLFLLILIHSPVVAGVFILITHRRILATQLVTGDGKVHTEMDGYTHGCSRDSVHFVIDEGELIIGVHGTFRDLRIESVCMKEKGWLDTNERGDCVETKGN